MDVLSLQAKLLGCCQAFSSYWLYFKYYVHVVYGWRPVVAAKTAAAVRGSADCCTGLGVPGQPWTAAAAAAAARAPLTACGDWVPPAEPKILKKYNFCFD